MNDEIPNEIKTQIGTFVFNEYGNPIFRCTASTWLRKHNFIINSVSKSNIILHNGKYYFHPRGAMLINNSEQKSEYGTLAFDPDTNTVKPTCEAGQWLKENGYSPDQMTINDFKFGFKSDQWMLKSSDKPETNQQPKEVIENNKQPEEIRKNNQLLKKQLLESKIQKRKQTKKIRELLNCQQMQYIHQMRELQKMQQEYQLRQLEIVKLTQISNQSELKRQSQDDYDPESYEYNDYYDHSEYEASDYYGTNDYYDNSETNDYYDNNEYIEYFDNENNEYYDYSEYNEL